MAINVLQAAKYLCEKSGWELTHLEIQKLLYIVYMLYWGGNNKALFTEHFQAWDLGPVNDKLYHKLKRFGGNPIKESAFRFVKDLQADENVIHLLNEVLKEYPPGSSAELVAYTHRPGTAWHRRYMPNIRNIIITNNDIQKEYKNHVNGLI